MINAAIITIVNTASAQQCYGFNTKLQLASKHS